MFSMLCIRNEDIKVNPGPAGPGYAPPCQTVQIQIKKHWSGSALFVIQYVNLNQQPGSINLIGWQLEVGVASLFIQPDKG